MQKNFKLVKTPTKDFINKNCFHIISVIRCWASSDPGAAALVQESRSWAAWPSAIWATNSILRDISWNGGTKSEEVKQIDAKL